MKSLSTEKLEVSVPKAIYTIQSMQYIYLMAKYKAIVRNKTSLLKAYFSMKPAKKIFRLLGGKMKFELALQPSTAWTAKIQIQFSRQGD